MLSEWLGLVLVIKFYTVGWLFDFTPSKAMFRKQLETSLSTGLLCVLLILMFNYVESNILSVLSAIYLIFVVLVTESLYFHSFHGFRYWLQHRLMGLGHYDYDTLPGIIKDDFNLFILTFYNAVYVVIVVVAILWPK